jgi:hypothetical protein
MRPLPADRLRIWPVERTVNTGSVGGATAGVRRHGKNEVAMAKPVLLDLA